MDSLLLNRILYPAICGRENHYSYGHYFHVKDKGENTMLVPKVYLLSAFGP